MSARVIGLPELGARIEATKSAVRRQGVRKALAAGAEVFRRDLRAAAPVRTKGSTGGWGKHAPGYLKRHIGRSLRVENDGSGVADVGPMKSAPEGRWYEKGTRAHAIGRGSNIVTKSGAPGPQRGRLHPGQPARPWIAPVFSADAQKAQQAFADALGKFLDTR